MRSLADVPRTNVHKLLQLWTAARQAHLRHAISARVTATILRVTPQFPRLLPQSAPCVRVEGAVHNALGRKQ
jgi:hypothetical protein